MHAISEKTAEAMRLSIHETPQDFKDATLPFVRDQALQRCPGIAELREAVSQRIAQIPPLDDLRQLKGLRETSLKALAPQSIVESIQNAFGISSRRQSLALTENNRAQDGIVRFITRWKAGEEAIATLMVDYVRDTFVPSPALAELQHQFEYFSNKLALDAPISESTKKGQSPRPIEREKYSEFLSAIVHKIARLEAPEGNLTLTSKDGSVVIDMGPVSSLYTRMREVAKEYTPDAYSHRRSLLATAFLSVLATEEERVSRHYKLLVTEIQNALHLDLPENWVNSCFNAASSDLWVLPHPEGIGLAVKSERLRNSGRY